MRLTILSVAFPLAPVTSDPVGGAEQVLAWIDRALVAAGHRSIVIAPEGSEVAGELLPVPACDGEIEDARTGAVQAAVRARLQEAIARERPDVVHLHGLDFHHYLPPPGPPVLVTLHLPLAWYPADALVPDRPRTFLHPVSASQAALAPPDARLRAPIENGVPIPPAGDRKRRYVFAMGRICPEKGFDDALDAAARAHMPLLLAGRVFPYPVHQAHFRNAIAPRLGWRRRWIGPVAGVRKQRLLAEAQAVLIPSKAPETSSLVAMEAMAAGTPVVAYGSGALAEIVEPGLTGFLVEGVAGLVAGLREVRRLDAGRIRARAVERFSVQSMTEAYFRRYAELAA